LASHGVPESSFVDKAMASIYVSVLGQLRKEGFKS
jgi:hypothetical protein